MDDFMENLLETSRTFDGIDHSARKITQLKEFLPTPLIFAADKLPWFRWKRGRLNRIQACNKSFRSFRGEDFPARRRKSAQEYRGFQGGAKSTDPTEFSFEIPTMLINPPFWFQVSWMRKRDLHILTSSIYTYTGDERFSVKHPEASDEWTLKIDYVQQRDAGVYECQVNTEPKMNLAFVLRVEGKILIISSLSSSAIDPLASDRIFIKSKFLNELKFRKCRIAKGSIVSRTRLQLPPVQLCINTLRKVESRYGTETIFTQAYYCPTCVYRPIDQERHIIIFPVPWSLLYAPAWEKGLKLSACMHHLTVVRDTLKG